MKEEKRNDGKKSWVTDDFRVIVYDPEVCTPELFERETGISLKTGKRMKLGKETLIKKILECKSDKGISTKKVKELIELVESYESFRWSEHQKTIDHLQKDKDDVDKIFIDAIVRVQKDRNGEVQVFENLEGWFCNCPDTGEILFGARSRRELGIKMAEWKLTENKMFADV